MQLTPFSRIKLVTFYLFFLHCCYNGFADRAQPADFAQYVKQCQQTPTNCFHLLVQVSLELASGGFSQFLRAGLGHHLRIISVIIL